ncbi:MAG: hypothetical protein KGM15_00735 [Pseudomonadota bacterium]|nr:hypothetical protein [Pseudomonadota bacterium]
MTSTPAAALPLGGNCHVGMALTRFGHHESSLLRWADIPLPALLAFVERGGGRLFSGRTAFRFVGTTFGTLDFDAMRERLGAAAPGGRINTLAYAAQDDAYVHGVQLSLAEAGALSYDAIAAANAEKLAHLDAKWRAVLAGAAPVAAIRLEWAPVGDATPFLRLYAALKRAHAGLTLHVVSPEGGLQTTNEGVKFTTLRSPLPPLSDVMNVSATQAEWSALFSVWGVRPQGAAKPYIFDL